MSTDKKNTAQSVFKILAINIVRDGVIALVVLYVVLLLLDQMIQYVDVFVPLNGIGIATGIGIILYGVVSKLFFLSPEQEREV